MHFRVIALASLIAFAGCTTQSDPPDSAPKNVAVTAGDGRVTVTWTPEPDLAYWIFFQQGSTVVAASNESLVLANAVSPQVVPLLTNGTQYAFVMNATKHDSAAGPSSLIVTATPRLAGLNWDLDMTAAFGTANLNGIALGGNRFVAVGDSPAVGVSPAVFAGDYNYHYTIANPPGVSAWNAAISLPAGFAANLQAVAFTGQFVALGSDRSILTSSDGLTWTLKPDLVPTAGMNAIAFGAGRHVVAGNGGNIYSSTDLVTWDSAILTPATANDFYSVSFLNGAFIATGANGSLFTSSDGLNWMGLASGTTSALRGAAFRVSIGVRYVAVGDGGTIVTSLDGIAWNPVMPAPTTQNLRSIVHSSRFVAVGQGGAVVFSDDGTTWTLVSLGTAQLSQVLSAPGMYIAVGAAGANVASK